jgi:hypothetical protein
LRVVLVEFQKTAANRYVTIAQQSELGRIDSFLQSSKSRQTTQIQPGETWADQAVRDFNALSSEERALWENLITHCLTAQTSKPTQKWSKAARQLVCEIGEEKFKAAIMKWFPLVASPRTQQREWIPREWSPDPNWLITDRNATILKGLAWSCSGLADANVSRALSELAEICFKKVRWLGPRCPKVGNACLYSLSTTESDDASAQLSRLDSRVKQPTARKRIGKSLDAAASLTGQTREDLEEKVVPAFGLDGNGRLTRPFGLFTATVEIVGTSEISLTWKKIDGKLPKAVPSEVKEKFSDEWKVLQRIVKDIEKMLPAQRDRIERLLSSEREWPLEQWRERYLNHPLLAHMARRLIWHFRLADRTSTGIWHEGKLADVQNRPLDWLGPQTQVRLWHPVGFSAETVSAWRKWLEAHQVVQPFKQAHREIYILTDAELTTRTYSNRFAAHIIKQHQFATLAKQRNWKYTLQGNFDSHNTPTLLLPRWNLSVEFWVNGTGGPNDLSPTGIFLYLSTAQVRFHRDGQLLPLSEVPALAFTEVMRDVDLFTGVCSIGNDPAWNDRGDHQDYWREFSFGELSSTADTRKEILQRLIPKLRITDRCSFSDRFLVVRGDLRTYKIHLGSSNILMEPNDQYLCIVSNQGAAAREENVFLPFEGDHTFAVILSKAFLLADDAKIKDASIVNQIKRS